MDHTIKITVPARHVQDALVCATRACRYWADIALFTSGEDSDVYVHVAVHETDGGADNAKHSIALDQIVAALPMMAQYEPKWFGRLIAGDVDAGVCDCLVQFATFGYLKYG